MKRALNVGTTLIGSVMAGFATDGWAEVALIVGGLLLITVQFDYKMSLAESALRMLGAHYRFMHHLWMEIDREWRPMGGQENEAKRVIVAEIRDTIPAHVQELIEKELRK